MADRAYRPAVSSRRLQADARFRRLLLVLAVSSLGCGADVVFVEAPEIEGAQSYLFALEQDPEIEIFAQGPVADGFRLSLDGALNPELDVRLTRIALAAPLSLLGLEPGDVQRSAPPNRLLGELPTLGIDAALLSSDSGSARFEPSRLSAGLAAFEVPRPSKCPSNYVLSELGPSPGHRELVSVDPDTAVLLMHTQLAIVRSDRSVEFFPLPPGEDGRAIAISDTGRVWVATSSAVRSFDPASGNLAEPAVSTSSSSYALGMFVREVPTLQVWLFDREGQLLRHDASGPPGFEVRYQLPEGRVGTSIGSVAARFAPTEEGGFVVVCRGTSSLFEYHPSASLEFREELARSEFATLYTLSDGTIVVVDIRGQVYERRNREWRAGSTVATEIIALAPVADDRLFYTTQAGIIGVLSLSEAQCPSASLGPNLIARAVAAVGTGFVLTPTHRDGAQTLVWVELEPAP